MFSSGGSRIFRNIFGKYTSSAAFNSYTWERIWAVTRVGVSFEAGGKSWAKHFYITPLFSVKRLLLQGNGELERADQRRSALFSSQITHVYILNRIYAME